MDQFNVTLNVKPFDSLSTQEIVSLSDNMGRSKADLLIFIHYFGDSETLNLANDFIQDNEDAVKFEYDFFSGGLNPDELYEDMGNYVKYCYEECYREHGLI